MGKTADLEGAIEAGDEARALELALDLWRETRAPELADLIDFLGAASGRIVPWPEPPRLTWTELVEQRGASHPFVTAVGTLGNHYLLPLLDEIATALTWPDDPRLARPLVDWLQSERNEGWTSHHEIGAESVRARAVFQLLAARLVALGDARAVRHLGVLVRLERTQGAWLAKLQAETLDGLRARTRHVAPWPELGALVERVRQPAEPAAIRALWDEAVAHPEDLGLRRVLGDALVEHGDERGEIFAFQCDEDPVRREKRAKWAQTGLRRRWHDWLGALGAMAARTGTEFRNGMLETVRIGLTQTPLAAYPRLGDHRELRAVREIRPNDIDPRDYAALLARLDPFPPTVGFHCTEAIAELRELRPTIPATTIELRATTRLPPGPRPGREGWRLVDELAALAPSVERLRLGLHLTFAAEPALIATLPARFPRLRAIEVAPSLARTLVGIPLVEVAP
ncbi:MAG TPA: hypothetical protein VIU61_09305 [Kofleriaceae bacterium]